MAIAGYFLGPIGAVIGVVVGVVASAVATQENGFRFRQLRNKRERTRPGLWECDAKMRLRITPEMLDKRTTKLQRAAGVAPDSTNFQQEYEWQFNALQSLVNDEEPGTNTVLITDADIREPRQLLPWDKDPNGMPWKNWVRTDENGDVLHEEGQPKGYDKSYFEWLREAPPPPKFPEG